jgi:formylglycine-generating enzyme required for sulfatase activity
MTRAEALELLDLPEGADNEEIVSRYREFFNDYQMRLTNAPTAQLKNLYTQNIEKLELALQLLCPETEADMTKYLPTDKPMFHAEHVNITKTNTGNTEAATPKIDKEQGKTKTGGGYKVLFFISVVLLVMTIVFFLIYKERGLTNHQNNKYIIETIESNMIFVEGGTFTMGCTNEQGSDCWDSENPRFSATVNDFYIGKYEVTQAQWRAVMGSDPPELYFIGCDNCPVEGVSWNDIQEFLKKLNQQTGKTYRLPTEAEWEFSARGGNISKGYKYAGSNNIDEVAWYTSNSSSQTHPVGRKKPNELGLHDMSGNVWEWCSDWYSSYTNSNKTNPTGPSSAQTDRVLRGGSWYINARYCRVSYRHCYSPDYRYTDYGFRVVLSQFTL